MNSPPAVVVLAAGKGTRMKSALPKVLHPLAGMPMLGHVLAAVGPLAPEPLVVVIGHGAARVREVFAGAGLVWVEQTEQLGTAHAVQCALPALRGATGEVLILNGDAPLIQPATLQALLAQHRAQGAAVTVLGMTLEQPHGYGRLLVEGGQLQRIVEEKDADAATRAIRLVNSGSYCVDLRHLEGWLGRVSNGNAQGEFYLPDIVAMARSEGLPVGVMAHDDAVELSGINSRVELARLERVWQERRLIEWMLAGVTVIDPASCRVSADTRIGADTVLHPQVMLGSGVEIGQGCEVGPFCVISHSRIGDRCQVLPFSHLEGAVLAGDNTVGPYARLRPGAELLAKARVGNFVEIKKASIGVGSKVNHLSYIGDAELGAGVNVGAGTITCNYDGVHKHRTKIGDGAFIGSDTQLVAPVEVGANAIVGAGTTVTKPVPDNALAVSRTPQTNIPDYREFRRRQQARE